MAAKRRPLGNLDARAALVRRIISRASTERQTDVPVQRPSIFRERWPLQPPPGSIAARLSQQNWIAAYRQLGCTVAGVAGAASCFGGREYLSRVSCCGGRHQARHRTSKATFGSYAAGSRRGSSFLRTRLEWRPLARA